MAIRVILADDHQLVRAGLRALLQSFADVEVLAECSDGHEALAQVTQLKPDILMLDISMPGMNGLEVARRILEDNMGLKPGETFLVLYDHTTLRMPKPP